MTRVYYKEAVGAFVVFDITRVGTFEAVTKWKVRRRPHARAAR